MSSDGEAILEVRDLRKDFGGVRALDGVSFAIGPTELVGLIGPNGSGKTTAFNLLTGVLPPTCGAITFRGHDVTGNAPAENARLGMARTFQNIRLFRDLPVVDNVMVGVHMRRGPGFWPTILQLPGARRAEADIRRRAMEALSLLGLEDRAAEIVGNLPYGDQRKVELARALASEPALLLLDEPTAGMNPRETTGLAETIRRLHRDLGIAILLVEHDMKMVMGLCERIVVFNQGRKLAAGTAREVQNDSAVIEAYLGRRRERAHADA